MRRLPFALVVTGALLLAMAIPAGATPPSDVSFEVETSLLGDPSRFNASGPAVDEGLICGAGLVTDATGKLTGLSPTGFNFQGIKVFDCDDGSGQFYVNLQARIDFRKGTTFNWNVLGGTDDYVALHGAGEGIGLPGVPCGDPGLCVLDLYGGGLHIES